tara:strand:- start:2971 stop:4518 length:1548 start_codon:yes stop_codon:yes gene_type:complete
LYFSITFVAILNIINSLAPPTDADSMNLHLSVPKYYLSVGEILPVIYYRDMLSPPLVEMWNLLCLMVKNGILAQFIQVIMGMFSALALYRLTYERLDDKSAIFVAVFYYISPKIIMLSGIAKPDTTYFGFIFLSLHFLILWKEKKYLKYFYISALLTGFSLATKYHGLFWTASIGLVCVLYLYRAKGEFNFFKNIIIYGLLIIIVAFPFYLRNYLATGDPIWPYGWSLFNTQFWTQRLHDKFSNWTAGPGDSIYHYFAILWNVTLNQNAWSIGYKIPYLPIQLALLPGLYVIKNQIKNKHFQFISTIFFACIIFYSFWFFSYQQLRYFIPVMSLLLIPCAYVFWLIIRKKTIRYFGLLLIIANLIFCLAFSTFNSIQYFPVSFGFEDKNTYLAKKHLFYDDIVWLNNNVGDDSKIFFLSLKPYYCNLEYEIPKAYLLDKFINMNTEQFYNYLISENITHIFHPRDTSPMWESKLDSLLFKKQARIIYKNDNAKRVTSRALELYEVVGLDIYEIIR